MLDDPVQHVDDFRSLNLVELLSSIRASGKQIICCIEDEALADLMSRRLPSDAEENGVKITLRSGQTSPVPTIERFDVPPSQAGVFRNRTNIQMVS